METMKISPWLRCNWRMMPIFDRPSEGGGPAPTDRGISRSRISLRQIFRPSRRGRNPISFVEQIKIKNHNGFSDSPTRTRRKTLNHKYERPLNTPQALWLLCTTERRAE